MESHALQTDKETFAAAVSWVTELFVETFFIN